MQQWAEILLSINPQSLHKQEGHSLFMLSARSHINL